MRAALGAVMVAAVVATAGVARADTPAPIASIQQAFPSRTAAFWPAYVAQAMGFYTKEGIAVSDVVVDPNVTVPSLIGGSVEVAYADSTNLMQALDKGANLVAVGLETDRNPYKLMAGPTIKTVAQLKGKKIGAASPIDVYTYVIKEILKKAGLDPDTDVDFVFGGGQNQRLTAIVGGAIDAGLFTPPGDARLASQGFNTLAFTPDYFPNLTLSVTTVRRDWAQANGDTLRRFLRAQSDAVKWLDNPANKDRAIAILVDQTKAAPADAADAYDYYVGKAHVFPDNACVHVPGLTNVVKIMRITNQLKTIGPADVPKFTDTEWCPK